MCATYSCNGIDVKDELGGTIYHEETEETATIQQHNFSKFKDGTQLERLWQTAQRVNPMSRNVTPRIKARPFITWPRRI